MPATATPQTLATQIRTAYFWTTALQFTKNLLGFGISLLLAHFLEPKDYGLVGMVTVLTGMLSVIQDCGLGQAIVYFDRSEDELATYFTVAAATGAGLTLATWAAAPLVGQFYGEPRLVPIMRVLSITLFLGSVRSVPQGLLTKHFQFRRLAIVESACLLSAGVVAVVLAWKGFGPWSLVANILCQTIPVTLVFCCLIRPRLTWRPDLKVLREALKWGAPLTGSSLLWQFYENSDYLVVGKVLGSSALGIYTVAFRFATVINDKASSIINRVSFPSFAAMKANPAEIAEHWFAITRTLAWINIPALAILALNARDFIAVFLGPQWLPAADLVRFLCIVGALKSFTAVTVNLVCAQGRTEIGFAFAVLNAILLPLSFLLGCQLASVRGVAIAWCVIFPLNCAFLTVKAARLAGVRMFSYCSQLSAALRAALLCLVVMIPAGWLASTPAARLGVRLAAAAISFGVLYLLEPDLAFTVRRMLGRTDGEATPATRNRLSPETPSPELERFR